MSDFFILSGFMLVGVFTALFATVQSLREQLKTARIVNNYLARRLSSELHAREERILRAPDVAYRKQVAEDLRNHLRGEQDPEPDAWAKRGDPRSYR